MTQKGNQNLVAYRRELVARLALRGLSVRAIAKQLASLGAPIENPRTRAPFSKSVIASDIAHMRREWREHAEDDISEHQARLLAKLEEVERQAWKKSDYALVLKTIDRIAKLLGLNAPERLQHSGAVGHLEFTEESARELLEKFRSPTGVIEDITPLHNRVALALGLDAGGKGDGGCSGASGGSNGKDDAEGRGGNGTG